MLNVLIRSFIKLLSLNLTFTLFLNLSKNDKLHYQTISQSWSYDCWFNFWPIQHLVSKLGWLSSCYCQCWEHSAAFLIWGSRSSDFRQWSRFGRQIYLFIFLIIILLIYLLIEYCMFEPFIKILQVLVNLQGIIQLPLNFTLMCALLNLPSDGTWSGRRPALRKLGTWRLR